MSDLLTIKSLLLILLGASWPLIPSIAIFLFRIFEFVWNAFSNLIEDIKWLWILLNCRSQKHENRYTFDKWISLKKHVIRLKYVSLPRILLYRLLKWNREQFPQTEFIQHRTVFKVEYYDICDQTDIYKKTNQDCETIFSKHDATHEDVMKAIATHCVELGIQESLIDVEIDPNFFQSPTVIAEKSDIN